ncbi:MAG: hypothetical protein J6C82_05155 [Clostridia bacterium]|nr:hypothetical protein [Clostridia bacterium]
MIDIGNVFILGDSYSTFEGFIPNGYATYYTNAGREETDVSKVEQTWWHQLLEDTESTLLKNCSYSGTTICNTGYDGRDCTDISFIARFDKLIEENYFVENKVDTFFLFGGTNDSWADSPIGELMYSDWKKEDLFCVLPAFCYLLNQVNINLPNTKVICIVNTELKSEIAESFKLACKRYSIDFVQLNEIDKKCGHPTIKGMKQIKDQILDCIK